MSTSVHVAIELWTALRPNFTDIEIFFDLMGVWIAKQEKNISFFNSTFGCKMHITSMIIKFRSFIDAGSCKCRLAMA